MDLSLSLPRMEGVDLRPWVPPEHSLVISSARRVLAAGEPGAAGQPAPRDEGVDVAADGVPASFLAMQWRASAGMAQQKLQVGLAPDPRVLRFFERQRASALCSATAARAPARPPWPWTCKELHFGVDGLFICAAVTVPHGADSPAAVHTRARRTPVRKARPARGRAGRAQVRLQRPTVSAEVSFLLEVAAFFVPGLALGGGKSAPFRSRDLLLSGARPRPRPGSKVVVKIRSSFDQRWGGLLLCPRRPVFRGPHFRAPLPGPGSGCTQGATCPDSHLPEHDFRLLHWKVAAGQRCTRCTGCDSAPAATCRPRAHCGGRPVAVARDAPARRRARLRRLRVRRRRPPPGGRLQGPLASSYPKGIRGWQPPPSQAACAVLRSHGRNSIVALVLRRRPRVLLPAGECAPGGGCRQSSCGPCASRCAARTGRRKGLACTRTSRDVWPGLGLVQSVEALLQRTCGRRCCRRAWAPATRCRSSWWARARRCCCATSASCTRAPWPPACSSARVRGARSTVGSLWW